MPATSSTSGDLAGPRSLAASRYSSDGESWGGEVSVCTMKTARKIESPKCLCLMLHRLGFLNLFLGCEARVSWGPDCRPAYFTTSSHFQQGFEAHLVPTLTNLGQIEHAYMSFKHTQNLGKVPLSSTMLASYEPWSKLL